MKTLTYICFIFFLGFPLKENIYFFWISINFLKRQWDSRDGDNQCDRHEF